MGLKEACGGTDVFSVLTVVAVSVVHVSKLTKLCTFNMPILISYVSIKLFKMMKLWW